MEEFRFCPRCARPLEEVRGGSDAGRRACPEGHFVHYGNPAVTVMAWIAEGEDFLVLQRAREPKRLAWDLPGGFVEAGEHPHEAVRREVREETGLDVAPRRLIGIYPGTYGDGGKPTLDLAFLCRVRGGTFALSPESLDARWLPLTRFPAPAFASVRAALGDLRDRLG
ncbi:MAG TPA: NUDIX hydrolase [Solirubrobacteraceae bacterium]|nr:NUDIX hydrolase [Solirubrobacteraceae bacterium]